MISESVREALEVPSNAPRSESTSAEGYMTTFRPERSLAEWGIVFIAFALTVIYLHSFYSYIAVLNLDEGIMLQGAQRILSGQVMYRDFFYFVTPGSDYWMALLFKAFGSSILVARAALMVYGGLFSVFTYLVPRRVSSRANSILAIIPTVIVALPYRFIALHNWDSTLWALLALYCAVRWLEAMADQEAEGRSRKAEVAQRGKVETQANVILSERSERRIPAFVILSEIRGFFAPLRMTLDQKLAGSTRICGPAVWPWALATGGFASITCLFEQSKGAGLALGLAVGFLAVAWSDPGGFRIDRRSAAALGLGFALPFVATIGYFAAHHALPQMAAGLLWPFHHYARANKVPYGYIAGIWQSLFHGTLAARAFWLLILSPFVILSALPLFAPPVVACSMARLRKGCRDAAKFRYYLLVSAVLSGLLLSTLATGRLDAVHFFYLAPLSCIVVGWMAEAARSSFLRSAKAVGGLYAMVSFLSLGLALLSAPLAAKAMFQTRRGEVRGALANQELRYVEDRIPAGEKILVYPYQPLLYYLTGTFSVSRYQFLLLGMNDPSQFERMKEEVQAAQPRVVLFNPLFRDVVASAFPYVPLAVLAAKDPVAEYIASNYRVCRDFPSENHASYFVFMIRKDLSCGKEGLAAAARR